MPMAVGWAGASGARGARIPVEAHARAVHARATTGARERKERLPSGRQTVINNRVGWARTYLNKAGLLVIPERGMVQITDRGRDALHNGPDRITVRWLKQFPEFERFHTHTPKDKADDNQDMADDLDQTTPDERLAEAHG